MSGETAPPPAQRSPVQRQRFRLGAVLALALAVGLVVWLALRDTGSPTSKAQTTSATAASAAQLASLATSVGHPVFWIGSKKGYSYQLSRLSNGTVQIVYLPPGAKASSGKPYLTVATYPFPGAFAALQAVAKQTGSTPVKVPHGGVGEFSSKYPESVHVAYPGVDYQVEVFDPSRGAARAMVASGRVTALGPAGASGTPAAISLAGLRSLAHSLGHPIYWVGPKKGYTYELTRAPSGQIYLRYLPRGVKVGARGSYLIVATYPFPGAFGALQGLANQKDEVALTLPGGGLALINKGNPNSIHLAYPGSDYQVEVFDPSSRTVRQLVASGRVSAVG
jgi:hypothetical protein